MSIVARNENQAYLCIMGMGARNANQAPADFVEVPCATHRPLQIPVVRADELCIIGKGTRNKNQPPARIAEVQGTKARPLQGDEADFGSLTNTVTGLLGAAKNISLQLDEISSTVNGLVNNSKDIDVACGKSTPAEPFISVDSKRDVVGEFHDLKQTTTVAEYQEKFEELRDLMVERNYGLSEGYLVSSFLSGLKSEVKESIANRKPETLYHAFNLARVQEIAIGEMKEK
ncbi:OLC1v1000379C1 [Oldenlandia corymbosa var. corymbosa]|uniref:OLC1v1000379C1 n=1 Tax=Oldenlandia corymbosa var. corymbosa TaxID=529605 RepID=A0AAV1D332_OLDCO|nr:OLC1v1000379C1 [Oldenlandia corymbosa var. corymbosa]